MDRGIRSDWQSRAFKIANKPSAIEAALMNGSSFVSVITGLTSGGIEDLQPVLDGRLCSPECEWFNSGNFYILLGDYTHKPGTNSICD